MASAVIKRSSNGDIAHVQDIFELYRSFQSSKDELEKQKVENDLRSAIAELVEDPEQIPDTTFNWSGLAEIAFNELEAANVELFKNPWDNKRDKRFHVAVSEIIEAVFPDYAPLPWIQKVLDRKPKEEYFPKGPATFEEQAHAYFQWEYVDGPYYEDNTWEYLERMSKAKAMASAKRSSQESDNESGEESDE